MTESNVFNQSFDDLLAQAGIAGSNASGETPVKEEQKAEPAVMSFDDILQQEGLEDVTNNPSTTTEVTAEPNITEEYRVTTDVFGENDKPNDVPTFEDLMAQAGGVETKDAHPDETNDTSQPEVAVIPSFDDLMAQAGALDTKPQVEEEVTTEVKEEVKPEVKEEVTSEVKEKVTPEVASGIPSFDDLMAQAGALDTKSQVKDKATTEVKEEIKEEVIPEVKPEDKEEATAEVKEEATAEVKEEVKPEVKDEVTIEIKEEVKPKTKRTRTKTKTTEQPSETLIDKDTVDEINTAIHGIVRNAVRNAFKDAMNELTKAFE